jgi:hypothetical protein
MKLLISRPIITTKHYDTDSVVYGTYTAGIIKKDDTYVISWYGVEIPNAYKDLRHADAMLKNLCAQHGENGILNSTGTYVSCDMAARRYNVSWYGVAVFTSDDQFNAISTRNMLDKYNQDRHDNAVYYRKLDAVAQGPSACMYYDMFVAE